MAKARNITDKATEVVEQTDTRKVEKKVEQKSPEKPVVRFAAHPGYSLIRGSEEITFPYETDDQDLIAKIKKGRGFRANEIWVDERTEVETEAAEEALSGLSYVKLQRMVSALGYRNVGKYKKIELIDILSNSKLGG